MKQVKTGDLIKKHYFLTFGLCKNQGGLRNSYELPLLFLILP